MSARAGLRQRGTFNVSLKGRANEQESAMEGKVKAMSLTLKPMNTCIKVSILGLCFLIVSVQGALAQEKTANPSSASRTNAEQEIISLSKEKWLWMAERKVDSLDALFHEEAVFVHMGGTMSKSQELGVIKSGGIHYKQADVQEVSVRFVGTTAILLNRIRLVAVVGGNEVVNPFVVTEVYVQQSGTWKLVSLSFTRLNTP